MRFTCIITKSSRHFQKLEEAANDRVKDDTGVQVLDRKINSQSII